MTVVFISASASGWTTELKTPTPSGNNTNFGSQDAFIADRDLTIPNSITIYEIGLYLDAARTVALKMVENTSGTTYDVVANLTGQSHGGTGWEWFELSSAYSVPASGTFYAGAHVASIGTIDINTRNNAEVYGGSSNISGTGNSLGHFGPSRETFGVGIRYA